MLFICSHIENLILFCKIYISPISSTFCFKILDFGVVGFFSPLLHLQLVLQYTCEIFIPCCLSSSVLEVHTRVLIKPLSFHLSNSS